MDATRYIACLWPGLPELWYRGRWTGIPAAVMFAVCLNFLIVARFIYPEWLIPALVRIACWVGICLWGTLVIRSASRLPKLLQPRAVADTPDPFPEAQQQYLRGEWQDAEASLAKCLEVDGRDCQALLLLASVYRQTGRAGAAGMALEQLGRLETADHWWLEREAEKRRLQRHVDAVNEQSLDSKGEPEASENAAQAIESNPLA